MKNKVFHNWTLKLTSVVIALVLWVIIYNINDPEESKRIFNVPVTFVNTEVITDDNQVYSVLNGTDVVRSITVHSTRSIIDSLKDSDINVEADFKKMKMDGTVELNIYSDRHNDSLTFSSSSKELQLFIEDKIDRYLSLELEMIGEPAEGYIVGSHSLGQNQIKVSGAESLVDAIVTAKAVVDMTGTNESISAFAEIVLRDAEGKEIPKERLEISAKNVITTVDVLATKTVPITYVVEGTAAEGYVATGEVLSEVTEIVIAGKENVIAPITEILVEDDVLSIEDASEDVTVTIDIDKYFPTGISRANKQGNGQIKVTLPIAPVINREIELRAGQVTLTNIPEGYSVDFVLRSAELIVTVRGADYILEGINSVDVKAAIDVRSWMEQSEMTSLEHEAVYLVVPNYTVREGVEVTASSQVEIISRVLEE